MRFKPVAAILCFAFILHVSILIYYKLNPELPSIKHYKNNLKEIDFPIAFKFCIEEKGENDTSKLKDLGYKDLSDFFYGISMFNDPIVGWAGHTKNGSTIGSVEGLNTKQK